LESPLGRKESIGSRLYNEPGELDDTAVLLNHRGR
jgi:hypothetical protein